MRRIDALPPDVPVQRRSDWASSPCNETALDTPLRKARVVIAARQGRGDQLVESLNCALVRPDAASAPTAPQMQTIPHERGADVLIVGAGIAAACVAHWLAPHTRVIFLSACRQ